MSTEKSFWKWLRGYLPLGLYTRLESPISPGVPDVYFNVRAIRGWIELKSIKAPKRNSAKPLTRKGLNEDQIIWISAEMRNIGNVWIFIKMGRVIYIYSGLAAHQLNQWTFEQLKENAVEIISLGEDECQKQMKLRKTLLSESHQSVKSGSLLKLSKVAASPRLTSQPLLIKKK